MEILKELYYIGIFGYLKQTLTPDQSVSIILSIASILLCIAAGYFLGSINTAIIVSKLFYGDDIRKYGSGNAGMTNVLRTYGKKAAVLTLLGDILKTVLAIIIGRFIGTPEIFLYPLADVGIPIPTGGYIAGLFAAIGHTFPIYYRFRGGKGVLCAATIVLMLSPFTFLWCFIIFVILLLGTKYVSLGSVISVMVYPIILNNINGSSPEILFAILLAILVVYNHRENIKRLLSGTENKFSIGGKKKSEEESPDNEEE